MARTVNQQFQTVKRAEIVDAALQLVSSRGYEAMSIQELLDVLGISKGALYHYIRSKSALLEAIVDRLLRDAEQALTPIAKDQSVVPFEGISRFFVALGRYKATQKPFILAVLPVWYSDDNAIVRDKVRVELAGRLAPLVASIIRRGCDEHTFAVSSPDQAARVVLGLTQDLADELARLLLTGDTSGPNMAAVTELMIAATTEAVERVLAAPSGSIRLVEPGGLDAWLRLSEGHAA